MPFLEPRLKTEPAFARSSVFFRESEREEQSPVIFLDPLRVRPPNDLKRARSLFLPLSNPLLFHVSRCGAHAHFLLQNSDGVRASDWLSGTST